MYNYLDISSEFKRSLKSAFPLIVSELIYALNGFITTVMVAHLGKDPLAANAIVWSIYLAVVVFFAGIFYSVSIMISQSFGANNNVSISIVFKQGLIMVCICSIPMFFVLWNVPTLLILTNQDPKVIEYTRLFFRVLALSVIPFNIVIVVQQFLMGINKMHLVMFLSIVTVPIEIFFYYSFLYGKFGFPQVGFVGIAYGLVMSYFIVAIASLVYLRFSKQMIQYDLFSKWWVVERKFLIEIIRIGLPMGLMWCSELVFFAIVALMMGALGTNTLAAYQISYQFLAIALIFIIAISKNVSMRVGNEVGRNDLGRLKLSIAVNLSMSLILMFIFCSFYFMFPEIAIGIDIDVKSIQFKEVVYEATNFFPLVGILLMTDCVRLISCGALRSLKDTKVQMCISIFGFWGIAFLGAYFLAFKLGLGGLGVWLGIIVGLLITGIVLFIRLIYLTRSVDLKTLIIEKEVAPVA